MYAAHCQLGIDSPSGFAILGSQETFREKRNSEVHMHPCGMTRGTNTLLPFDLIGGE